MINHVRVAVLGAGFSGLCTAIQLKKNGIDSFVVFEKASKVGGTWRENVYPGVACDVPSHLYSFSFALNPNWSRMFSPGWEIQDYIEQCVDRFRIGDQIRCNSEVKSVRFENNVWRVLLEGGETYTADVVVSGLGGLHIAHTPEFEGSDRFKGALFHSAEWDERVEIAGKNVAIVGTGASAIQILPELQKVAKQVCVYQRTPPWIVPRNDRVLSKDFKSKLSRFPLLLRLFRWFLYCLMELRVRFIKKDSPTNLLTMKTAMSYLRAKVQDPVLRDSLTPRYAIGCKRILLSDDYYDAIQQPNVELVQEPIEAFSETGIVTYERGFRPFDIVIMATGFKPFAINRSVQLMGRDGTIIEDVWSDRIQAHRTLMVPRFPNFFMLLGPNSGLGHNSVILMIEAQVRFILRALKSLERLQATRMEPRLESMTKFNRSLRNGLSKTVYGGGCNAWYTDENDHNFTLWPYSTLRYFLSMWRVNRNEFVWER